MSTLHVHAGSLRRILRHVLAAAVVGPLPLVVVAACSSGSGGPFTGVSEAGGEGSTPFSACHAAERVDAPTCGSYTVLLAGDLSTCDFLDAGVGTRDFCESVCGGGVSFCERSTTETSSVMCNVGCAVDGRRYARLDDRDAPTGATVAAYLARMAFFEAASVDAFALLAHDLTLHAAPASLVRSCRAARRDEVRHARMATKLARRHGGVVVAPPIPRLGAARELEAIAIENAVEGCVRETFGVVIGMWQAQMAPTASLRAFFAAVTADELRHAALSARIDTWLCSRLSPAGRARVESARTEAVAALEASLLASEPPAGLGLPTVAQARGLLAAWRDATTAIAA